MPLDDLRWNTTIITEDDVEAWNPRAILSNNIMMKRCVTSPQSLLMKPVNTTSGPVFWDTSLNRIKVRVHETERGHWIVPPSIAAIDFAARRKPILLKSRNLGEPLTILTTTTLPRKYTRCLNQNLCDELRATSVWM